MRARTGWWIAAPLLIALMGLECVDSPPTVAGSQPPTVAQTQPAPSSDVTPTAAQQSPIDIRGDNLRVVKAQEVPPLTFRYAKHATVDLENTGSPNEESTVRANVALGDGELRVGNVVYRLAQFHWHTPAEHEVDEQRFPMEMHLVHNGDDGSTLVIGVFLRAGSANATLTPIFNRLPVQSGGHASVGNVDIAALIPQHGEKSARYTGSLTTPPFTEGVHWVVIAPPIEVSQAQIAEFKALFPEGNAREVQALNGRTAATHDRHFERDEGVTANHVH